MNRWSTTNSHVSEHLMSVIDYCDFEDGMGCVYRVSGGESSTSIQTKAECSTPFEIFEVISDKNVPVKHDVACNTSATDLGSKEAPNGVICCNNCLRVIETAKSSDITKVIDDQTEVMTRDFGKKNTSILQVLNRERSKIDDTWKKVEVFDRIGNLKKDILEKMMKLDQLLNELEYV